MSTCTTPLNLDEESVVITMLEGEPKPCVTSLSIADWFGKKHSDIVANIEEHVALNIRTFDKFNCVKIAESNDLGLLNFHYVLSKLCFQMLTINYADEESKAKKEQVLGRIYELEKLIEHEEPTCQKKHSIL